MKRRFKYDAIRIAAKDGAFGYYLAEPIDDKVRLEIVSNRLTYLRQQAKLSQRDVCEIIGVATTTYSGYEQGKHEPSTETVCRLACLYGVSADFILGVGFTSVDDDRIDEHYMKCKDFEDLNMEHLEQSMAKVDEAEELIEEGNQLIEDALERRRKLGMQIE